MELQIILGQSNSQPLCAVWSSVQSKSFLPSIQPCTWKTAKKKKRKNTTAKSNCTPGQGWLTEVMGLGTDTTEATGEAELCLPCCLCGLTAEHLQSKTVQY